MKGSMLTLWAILIFITSYSQSFTPYEQSVLSRLRIDSVADLKNKDSIRGGFIRELVLNAKEYRIKDGIQIKNCIIYGDVNLNFLTYSSPLIITGCTFNGNLSIENADFKCIKMSQDIFCASADFAALKVGAFDVSYNKFKKDVNFNSMNILGDANFSHSYFIQIFNFKYAKIEGRVLMRKDTFENNVSLAYTNINQYLSTDTSVFAGSADFTYVNVKSSIFCDYTHFKRIVDLSGMQVGLYFFMKHDTLCSNLKAISVVIKGHMIIDTMKVDSGIAFGDSHFGTINAQRLVVNKIFDMRYTSFDYNLEIVNSLINNTHMVNMLIGARLILIGTIFKDTLSLKDSKAYSLDFTNMFYSKAKAVDIEGLSYSEIKMSKDTTEGSDSTNINFFNFIKFSKLATSNYLEFENYLNFNGKNAFFDCPSANWVYLRMKWREGHLGNYLLAIFAGNGRYPGFTIIWAVIFIFIGVGFFRSGKMGPVKEDEKSIVKLDGTPSRNANEAPVAKQIYNAFWYSFDLFLPIINLKVADNWRPRPEYKWLVNYSHFHTLIGWILIPLLLAAISGFGK